MRRISRVSAINLARCAFDVEKKKKKKITARNRATHERTAAAAAYIPLSKRSKSPCTYLMYVYAYIRGV